MNYATWELIFDDRGYGKGPENKIVELGLSCAGLISDNGKILGIVSEVFDTEPFSDWNLTFIDENEALSFAQSVDSEAGPNAEGYITLPGRPLENEAVS